jgi:Tfp pilus assembly protein PilN
MIKINLIALKKKAKLPVVMGVDLNQVNFKLIVIVWVLCQSPDYFLPGFFAEEITAIEAEAEGTRVQLDKIEDELKGNQTLATKVALFTSQLDKLNTRTKQVELVIKDKINPTRFLEKIVRNLPDDVWFDEVVLKADKSFNIKGYSSNYKSIGDYLAYFKSSPFFQGNIGLMDTKTESDGGDKGKRVEQFHFEGKVQTFEPFGSSL